MTQATAALLLGSFGWRIEGDLPNVSKAVIVGAPHSSNWDFALTLLTAYALGVRLQSVGKHTLFRRPLGPLMRLARGIRVDRRVSTDFVGAMVAEFKRRPAFLLAMMPQGTRRLNTPWKSGFHVIAREALVPIVPVIFNHGQRAVHFGGLYAASDDPTQDVAEIQSHYVGVQGKYRHG